MLQPGTRWIHDTIITVTANGHGIRPMILIITMIPSLPLARPLWGFHGLALVCVLLVSAMIGRVPSSFLDRSGPLTSISHTPSSLCGKGNKKASTKEEQEKLGGVVSDEQRRSNSIRFRK